MEAVPNNRKKSKFSNFQADPNCRVSHPTRRKSRSEIPFEFLHGREEEENSILNDNDVNSANEIKEVEGEYNPKKASPGKRRWKKISTVVRSLSFMQREEVRSLPDTNSLENEVSNYRSPSLNYGRKWKVNEDNDSNFLLDSTERAFAKHKRMRRFFECVENGSKEDLKEIEKIVETDETRFNFSSSNFQSLVRYILTPNDPEHIINRKNIVGETPLYIAARNANLRIAEFLVKNQANPNLTSKIGETPLEVAARWGHIKIVEFLLESYSFSSETLKKAKEKSLNYQVKSIFSDHLKGKMNGTTQKKTSKFWTCSFLC